jgi:hypothetical protein
VRAFPLVEGAKEAASLVRIKVFLWPLEPHRKDFKVEPTAARFPNRRYEVGLHNEVNRPLKALGGDNDPRGRIDYLDHSIIDSLLIGYRVGHLTFEPNSSPETAAPLASPHVNDGPHVSASVLPDSHDAWGRCTVECGKPVLVVRLEPINIAFEAGDPDTCRVP